MDLFEFTKEKFPLTEKGEFKDFLNEVWNIYKKEKGPYFRDEVLEEECKKQTQPFFNFDDDNFFCSRGYVGYVKFQDFEFNLYPKIFKKSGTNNIENCSDTLLLWLKYSNFRKLPNFQSSLDKCNSNIFEILIYLFAKYTADLFSNSLYQHYEIITEETNFLKGKLDFTNYVKNISCGKWHKFYCTYDSFEFNNKFNKIVKYVSNMLLQFTNNNENKILLQEILSILNDVDYEVCTENDCETVYINRFMEDFVVILDYCKIFLSNCISINSSGKYNAFAFLLKTEKLFEDFISNYIKEKFEGEYIIETQAETKLDNDGEFYIKPDILIYKKENKIKKLIKIIDVKYKNEKENDVSNSDIFQCITYGYKLGCNDLTLLYPRIEDNQTRTPVKIESALQQDGSKNSSLTLNFAFIDSSNEENLTENLNNIFLKN